MNIIIFSNGNFFWKIVKFQGTKHVNKSTKNVKMGIKNIRISHILHTFPYILNTLQFFSILNFKFF